MISVVLYGNFFINLDLMMQIVAELAMITDHF